MSSEVTEYNNDQTKQSDRNLFLLVGGAILLIGSFIALIFGERLFSNEMVSQPELSVQQTNTLLPLSGPPLQVGDQPYDFNLRGVNGERIILSEFIGRPILINFWATWCGPCRLEMPEIEAVWKEHRDDGLVVLALDQDETAADVQAFFDELGLTFTPVLDEGSQTAQNYGLGGTLPASVFINPDGEITRIHRGIMTRGQLDTFLSDTLPSTSNL